MSQRENNKKFDEISEEEYLNKINPTIRKTLTYEQRRELLRCMKKFIPRMISHHMVDIRFSFWFIKKWYLVFLMGIERRRTVRIKPEKAQHSILTKLLNIIIYFIMIMGVLATLFLVLYVIKSIAGFDLMPEKHFGDLF